MSGSRKVKSDSVEIETVVYVDGDTLRANGWVNDQEGVVAAVESWHAENHTGAFLWCNDQPCNDVVKASGK